MTSIPRTLRVAFAAAAVAGLVPITAPPATAAETVSILTSATSVGIGVSATLSGSTPFAVQTVVATDGTATKRFTVPTDGNGNGAFWWTPTSHGVWTVALDNGAGGDTGSRQVFVSAASSRTYLTAPNAVAAGSTVTFTAAVVPALGSTAPARGVVYLSDGTRTISSATLKGSSPATATFRLTVPSPRTTTFTALFVPADAGGLARIDCGTACASTPVRVRVTRAATDGIALAVPAARDSRTTVRVATEPGAQVTLRAGATSLGSATANRSGITTFGWVPKSTGSTGLTAEVRLADGSRRTTARAVTVGEGQAIDTIVLDPAGPRAAFTPTAPNVVAQGASLDLRGTAASGAPVTLSLAATKACALDGTRLTVRAGSGTCTVTARSAGGWGYVSARQEYVIDLIPRTP